MTVSGPETGISNSSFSRIGNDSLGTEMTYLLGNLATKTGGEKSRIFEGLNDLSIDIKSTLAAQEQIINDIAQSYGSQFSVSAAVNITV